MIVYNRQRSEVCGASTPKRATIEPASSAAPSAQLSLGSGCPDNRVNYSACRLLLWSRHGVTFFRVIYTSHR